MNDYHPRGIHRHKTQRTLDNPEVKKDGDWWDEVCKAHGEKNHWIKKKKAYVPKNKKNAK